MLSQFSELLRPQIFLYGLVALGIALLWRIKPAIPRRRLLVATVPFVLLTILCMPVVVHFILGSLEWRYPPLGQRPDQADAIVVLAGYVKPPDDVNPEPEPSINTFYRCLRAAELYRQGPRCPILVSGGKINPHSPGPTCAESMRVILLKLGVEPDDIVLEDRSRTTYENARESVAILHQRGLSRPILVTDATHLWRSELCFRKQGVDVIPCGCYYRATTFTLRPVDFVPDAGVLENVDQVAHEWLGLAWYWLTGKV